MAWDSFDKRERDRLKRIKDSLSGGFWNDGKRARLNRRIRELNRAEDDAKREAERARSNADRASSREFWDKFHDRMDRTFERGKYRK